MQGNCASGCFCRGMLCACGGAGRCGYTWGTAPWGGAWVHHQWGGWVEACIGPCKGLCNCCTPAATHAPSLQLPMGDWGAPGVGVISTPPPPSQAAPTGAPRPSRPKWGHPAPVAGRELLLVAVPTAACPPPALRGHPRARGHPAGRGGGGAARRARARPEPTNEVLLFCQSGTKILNCCSLSEGDTRAGGEGQGGGSLPTPQPPGSERKGKAGGGPWAKEGEELSWRGAGTLRASYKVHRCVCVSPRGGAGLILGTAAVSLRDRVAGDRAWKRHSRERGVRTPRGPPGPGGPLAGAGRREGAAASGCTEPRDMGTRSHPGHPVPRPPLCLHVPPLQPPRDTQPQHRECGEGEAPAMPCAGHWEGSGPPVSPPTPALTPLKASSFSASALAASVGGRRRTWEASAQHQHKPPKNTPRTQTDPPGATARQGQAGRGREGGQAGSCRASWGFKGSDPTKHCLGWSSLDLQATGPGKAGPSEASPRAQLPAPAGPSPAS